MTPQRLAARVIGWQVVFSCGTALLVHYLIPFLFLLPENQGKTAASTLALAVLIAGCLSLAQGWSLIWARRRLLSHLANKKRNSYDQIELPKLNDDPWQIVNWWLYTGAAGITLAMTVLRPAVIPPYNAFTLGLFAIVIQAAATLPLLMLVRSNFVRVMEQVPAAVMGEIIDAQVRSGHLRGRTSRRLLAAFATPVAFLAVGSTLIAGAHIRALEETQRRETARKVVGSALAPLGLTESTRDDQADLAILGQLSKAGYMVSFQEESLQQQEIISANEGMVSLHLPLKKGSAEIRFVATPDWTLNWPSVFVALLALFAARSISLRLARSLSRDLLLANHGVQVLGTDAAMEGTRVMAPARFRAVADLGSAIGLLAERFRQFTSAQEDSIRARQSATRARGRFFASVSHDLKSPLNAILGFSELTLRDSIITAGQRESLDMILHRGRELLILIETILDAARVEAGQLKLVKKDEDLGELLELSLNKASALTSDAKVLTLFDLPHDIPLLTVDKLRFSQALATFMAHARRTAERESLRVLVQAEPKDEKPSLKRRRVTLHIEIPSSQFSARELESMLNPEQRPGQHRGLSLALRLAKSVIELHDGTVSVTGRTVTEPAFAIHMRARSGY